MTRFLSKSAIAQILTGIVALLPVGYLLAAGKDVYSGTYYVAYPAIAVLSLALIWMVPMRNGRMSDTLTTIALALAQFAAWRLLEGLARLRTVALVSLSLCLPFASWLVLMLVAARLRHWLQNPDEVDGLSSARHRILHLWMARGSWALLSVLVALTLLTLLVPGIQAIYEDPTWVVLLSIALFFIASVGLGWMAEKSQQQILSECGPTEAQVEFPGIPYAVYSEVKLESMKVSRRTLNTGLVLGLVLLIVISLASLLIAGAGNWIAFWGTNVVMVLVPIVWAIALSRYRKHWYSKVRASGRDVEAYATVAKTTILKWPAD